MSNLVLGADIGGTHITAALVDLKERIILKETQVRQHVNAHGTADEIINAWVQVMEKTFNFMPSSRKIGIAMPNPVDYEKGISYIKGIDKFDSLYGINIKERLAAPLGISVSDILMKNDAGCFLQGEVFGGAARGFKKSIGLTLGTGIGTAWSVEDVAEDADLWHTPFKGKIVEDFISSRWFTRRYQEHTGQTVKGVRELVELYPTNEAVKAVFAEFVENFTEFLISFYERYTPEVIIMGGNIMHSADVFLPSVKANLERASINIPIKRAVLGEEAAILGSASCWMNNKVRDTNYEVR